MSILLDHVLFMVTQAAMNETPPHRGNDQYGPVHALEEALKQEKDIHIFLGSGTGLILEGPSGYTYQNILFSPEEWNKECNKLPEVLKPTCFDKIKDTKPETF